MLNNETFYPTPPELVKKMADKVIGHHKKILEPSAGKGDLIDALQGYGRETERYYHRPFQYSEFSAIEIDETLQATLRGKQIKVIDSNFLTFAGPDKFDLIIANPPFDEGDKHLLKAIEMMYRGEIVFLLNAETLRNPCTNTRKLLVDKLEELDAEIEYIQEAFACAERPTKVEVALIHIRISRNVEDDLFADCDDHAARPTQKVEEKHEISTGRTIAEMVLKYNQTVNFCTETILAYFRNFNRVSHYIGLNGEPKSYSMSGEDLTEKMQNVLNETLPRIREDYWRRTLELKEVRDRLTEKKREEFEHRLSERCHMDFTESNIRQFVLNIIGTYEQTLTEAVLDTFDMFTIRHCYRGDVHDKNVHYFNGWKTNNAYKVGKRVVIPIYAGYGSPFTSSYNAAWELDYKAERTLSDIDLVMSYFDGAGPYFPITEALKSAFADGENTAEGTYFKATAYKKGTIHLTFRDPDILRRFNICACRGKNWLPEEYGTKKYGAMNSEEKAVVNSFEGEKSYTENVGKALFQASSVPLIEAA